MLQIFLCTITILLMIFSVVNWYYLGKDLISKPQVGCIIPDNISCLVADIILHKSVTPRGISAYILELCSKGYLLLEKLECFYIKKLKNHTTSSKNEKAEFIKLFFNKNDYSKNVRSLNDLQANNEIYNKTLNFVNKKAIIIKPSYFKNSYYINNIAISIILLLVASFSLSNYSSQIYNGYNTIFIIALLLLLYSFFIIFSTIIIRRQTLTVVVLLSLLGLFLFLPTLGFYMLVNANILHIDYVSILAFFSFLISVLCSINSDKYNELGQSYLNQLLGLKTFIKQASNEQLEYLTKKEKDYYNKILPYAYLLNVQNEWINKFNIQKPNWLKDNEFSIKIFNKLCNELESIFKPTFKNGEMQKNIIISTAAFALTNFLYRKR